MFSLASIATMAACIFLFGIFFSVVTNFKTMVKTAEEGVAVTVFFEKGIEQDKIDEIGKEIKKRPEVAKYDFVSADEAWKDFQKEYFKGNKEAAEGFEEDNPLANSSHYEIYLNDVSMQKALVTYLKGLDGVREVHQSEVAANTLSDLNSLIGYISAGIILILIAVAVFLISNTIRTGISVRREEIAIMKLIGATDYRTDRFRVTADLTLLRIQQCHYLCFGEVCIFKQYAEFPSGRTGIPCIGSGSVAVRCRHRISWKPRNNKETFERVNLSQ